jgi:DNA-binding IclR family transcriptional regulator
VTAGARLSSIRRAVQVLDLLARKGPQGVRAVAQQLSLPLGSVHRLLVDLSEEDMVERTPDGEWDLSFRLIAITGRLLDRLQLPRLVRPFADRIAEATGETVNLYAVNGLACVCLDKVRGNERMQLDMPIGNRGAIASGGAGKAVLAHLPEEQVAQVLAAPIEPLTPATITDPAELRAELGRIRARGYAIDDQEVVTGVYCVSVPILDRHRRAVGAVSITGPSVKAAGPEIAPLVAMLNEACGFASRRLGYDGPWPPGAAARAVPQEDVPA